MGHAHAVLNYRGLPWLDVTRKIAAEFFPIVNDGVRATFFVGQFSILLICRCRFFTRSDKSLD